jgi:hypothetical protein
MRPYGFDHAELLRYSKAHAEMLAKEWRIANPSETLDRKDTASSGLLRGVLQHALCGVGAGLTSLRRRLVSVKTGTRGVATTSPADGGC